MSWSVSAIGKKAAVAASIEKQFASTQCSEPEESVRQKARALIAATLAASTSDVVKVDASGSASSTPVYAEDQKTVTAWKQTDQTLRLSIEPMWGFVEDVPAAA